MMIGDVNINDVKIGTTDVQKVMLGDVLVWERPMLMQTFSIQPEMSPYMEENVTFFQETPNEQPIHQKKGFFTGLWKFVKNLFKIG